MNQKTAAKCQQLVASSLGAGETIELTEAAQIGTVSAKKQVATQLAATIATGGALIVHLKPAAFYLVLTNQRLFLIENRRGLVGKVVAAIPRAQISAEPLRSGALTLSMQVTIDGTVQRFSWGRAQAGMARTVADALTALSAAS
jgi:hypothetical protein